MISGTQDQCLHVHQLLEGKKEGRVGSTPSSWGHLTNNTIYYQGLRDSNLEKITNYGSKIFSPQNLNWCHI